jgi:hypothetical protein
MNGVILAADFFGKFFNPLRQIIAQAAAKGDIFNYFFYSVRAPVGKIALNATPANPEALPANGPPAVQLLPPDLPTR